MNYLKSLLLITGIVLGCSVYSQEAEHEPGELLIQLKNGSDQDNFIRTYQSESGSIIQEFNQISKTANIYHIKFFDQNEDLNKAIITLYSYKEVIAVQKNHLVTLRETIPTDTLFSDQWFHKNTGQTGGTIDADIDTPDAWDITTGGVTTHGDTIVVCVIEGSGVDLDHPDLIDNIWHNYGEIPNNGIDDDNNGYIDDFDGWDVANLNDNILPGSHGTRVCGMVGARGNNVTGVSGVNWDVKMMIVSGQVASNEASVIAAYDYPLTMRKLYNETYGAQGAFVVVTNASWGINNGDPADAPLWCAMYDTLGSYGVLNVAATTNSNLDIDTFGDLPTTCPSEFLISVTMTDHDDVRANSGYGTINVDLAAPGSGVLLPNSTVPYSTTNGTSFASPCVAGAVALLYSAPCPDFITYAKDFPVDAAKDIRDYIFNGVDPIAALSGEVATGGRLNVFNTVDDLMSDCSLHICDKPYSLHTEFITDTSASLAWFGFTNEFVVHFQEGGNPEIIIPLLNQDTLYFDTLIPCTQYNVLVKGVCGFDSSEFSFPLNFTTDGCCENPPLYLDTNTVTSISVGWGSVLYGTQYDIIYKDTSTSTWDTLFNVTSPTTFPGLDTCTTYEFQIKTTCTDSTQGFSQSYLFTTLGCGSCYEASYCDVIGANDNLEWIDSIVVNYVISYTGANNGWYQSTDILTGFQAGQTYPVILKPGYSGAVFTEKFSIWIDIDQNGVFDATDKVLSNANTTSIINTNITIPASAVDGVTKMRIGMNGVDNPVECPSSSFFGEYEDYCVYIGEDAGIQIYEQDLFIYPNPTNDILFIVSTANVRSLKVYGYDGKLILDDSNAGNQIDVSHLLPGMYILQVETDQGMSTTKFIKQ